MFDRISNPIFCALWDVESFLEHFSNDYCAFHQAWETYWKHKVPKTQEDVVFISRKNRNESGAYFHGANHKSEQVPAIALVLHTPVSCSETTDNSNKGQPRSSRTQVENSEEKLRKIKCQDQNKQGNGSKSWMMSTTILRCCWSMAVEFPQPNMDQYFKDVHGPILV